MDSEKRARIETWLARQGAKITLEIMPPEIEARFEAEEIASVSLENYRWGDRLKASDRLRLLTEVRQALNAYPELPESADDIPDNITDADLHLKWLRS